MVENSISLDGLIMNAVETDPNGVIGVDTIFNFHQAGNNVHCDYAGGKVLHGYLVGVVNEKKLKFRYCQLESDGSLNGGASNCELIDTNGLTQIVEYFEWESRPGKGKNVIQEMK